MKKDIEILEKYYEQISENIKLDVNPSVFAAKCVKEYQEKKKIERRNEMVEEKKLVLEYTNKKNLNRKKIIHAEEEKLRKLGRISSNQFRKTNGDGLSESLKAIAKMVDIIRGD